MGRMLSPNPPRVGECEWRLDGDRHPASVGRGRPLGRERDHRLQHGEPVPDRGAILLYDFPRAIPSGNAVAPTDPISGFLPLGTNFPTQVIIPWQTLNSLNGIVFNGPRKIAPSGATFLFVTVRNDTGATVGTRCTIDFEVPG